MPYEFSRKAETSTKQEEASFQKNNFYESSWSSLFITLNAITIIIMIIESGYVGIDLYLLIIRGVTRGGTLDDSAFILISNSLIA